MTVAPDSGTRAAVGALAAVGVLIAVGAAVFLLVLQNGSDTEALPSPAASASTSTTGAAALPSSSASNTDGLRSMAAGPASSIDAREDWTFHEIAHRGSIALGGVAEARGTLYAFGSDGQGMPTVWYSTDGADWSPADVPAPDGGIAAGFGSFVDAGDRLVALGIHGAPGGSGPVGTVIYVSEDGSHWTQVEHPLGFPPLQAVAAVDARVVAGGQGVWISDDGGLTWSEVVALEQMGGFITGIAATDDLLIAVGERGLEIAAPPALAWSSRDDGLTWERIELDAEAIALGVAIGPAGRTVAVGGGVYTTGGSRVWISDDEGSSWQAVPGPPTACCLATIEATPTGFVMASPILQGHELFLSADGLDWRSEPMALEPRDVTWTPTFGLVIGAENGVVFGPEPVP